MSTTSRPFFLMTSPVLLDHSIAGCLVADPALWKMMDFVGKNTFPPNHKKHKLWSIFVVFIEVKPQRNHLCNRLGGHSCKHRPKNCGIAHDNGQLELVYWVYQVAFLLCCRHSKNPQCAQHLESYAAKSMGLQAPVTLQDSLGFLRDESEPTTLLLIFCESSPSFLGGSQFREVEFPWQNIVASCYCN